MAEQLVRHPATVEVPVAPSAPSTTTAPSVPGMMSPDEIQQRFRVAAALHQSGLYKDVGSAEQAFARLIVGRSLGLNEAQSLSLYAMEGKIEVPATMMAGWVHARGLGYMVEWREGGEWVATQTGEPIDACRVTIFERRISLDNEQAIRGAAVFSLDDAQKAGILKPNSGWTKYPRNMLYARAMSNAVRWYAPECLAGLPVYTEGEIERTPNLAEGQGDGTEPGWGTVPIAAVHEIEKIIRRAEKLGHAGLASRSAAQMLLNGQSDDVVRKWITDAAAELDNVQVKAQVERGERPAPEADGRVAGTLPDADPAEHPPADVDADPVLEPDGSTSWREGDDEPHPGTESQAPPAQQPTHAVQLELAEARLAGARTEAEEREALEELRRLRGEG
jgi:hypothetical protein